MARLAMRMMSSFSGNSPVQVSGPMARPCALARCERVPLLEMPKTRIPTLFLPPASGRGSVGYVPSAPLPLLAPRPTACPFCPAVPKLPDMFPVITQASWHSMSPDLQKALIC